MKIILLFALIFTSNVLFAQHTTGYVYDEDTKQPVAAATVKAGSKLVSTKENGYFDLGNVDSTAVITVNHISYKSNTYKGKTGAGMSIYMQRSVTALSSVVIRGNRNYKADSIRNRNEFSGVFDYKKTSLRDVFITKSGSSYRGPGNAGNSFNSIVSINLLQVAALALRNKTPVSKLQNRLLKDEQETYVNQRFSKEKVFQITSLKGDSLQNFINRIKPSAEVVKSMTEYDLFKYIKERYAEFAGR